MALVNAPQIITNGLVFCYDMFNAKSFKGAPTTNYAHDQNPRLGDTAYSAYSATSSGTWNAKHPDAIRVYNKAGQELSGYVNTGVTDWTNTYHAIWTYDYDLDKPVVTMRDYDGQWKAKSWGTGQTYASMGLSAGSTYTISWLQWTDDLGKSANAGLYSNIGFGDGLSNDKGATAYNTKIRTWQRVYATFTVNGTSNLASGISAYMYGHYGPRGTLKIADVQIEVGSVPSRFSDTLTRSNTQSVVDLTGNNIATVSSLTYASNNTFSFNGSNSFSLPTINFSAGQTIEIWMKPTEADSVRRNPYNQAYAGFGTWTHEPSGTINYYYGDGGADNSPYIGHSSSFTVGQNEIACVCTTRDTSTSYWYKNGVQDTSYAHSYGTLTATAGNITIGSGYAGGFLGDIYAVKLYNRALTPAEVKRNFDALKGKFGL